MLLLLKLNLLIFLDVLKKDEREKLFSEGVNALEGLVKINSYYYKLFFVRLLLIAFFVVAN